MTKSEITHKIYEPGNAVFISNILQAQRYLEYLGADYLLDIIWDGDDRDRCLRFVFPRCPETKHCKELWDQHKL